ncbi:MAG: acetylxylan esterase [candidate division Zixibacteria bacterium]|nr:acetylxylan esterase [candidate division Zixibacteria bacterium]
MPLSSSLSPLNRDFRDYLLRRLETQGRRQRFRGESRDEFEVWQTQARETLARTLRMPDELDALELVREPVSTGAQPWDWGHMDDSVHVERLCYTTFPGVRASAFLLVPAGATANTPAMLCPPGHGRGMNQVLFEHGAYRHYPFELARRGFVAMVPEHLSFGERVPSHFGEHGYYTGVAQLLGFTMYGVYIRELMRAVDVLASLPETDATQIGCYGLSLGGSTTLLLSALDLRIRAVGISGFLTSFRSTFIDVGHCVCGNVQDLALEFEHIDIASLIAPRPLVVESGRGDTGFPVDAATATVAELKKRYALFDREDRLAHDVFDGGHEISGHMAYGWFDRWLKE